MLSHAELEDLFATLGTPESGRAMIRKARREAPVRKVRSNRSNLITRYPSQKMQRVIETESHTVEFAAMLRYECDLGICEYFAQPMEVDEVLVSPSGKTDRLQHFPDFLLITPEGFAVEEWREESRLLMLALKRPERFIREEDGWRFPLAEEYFAERGISYRLRSADELPRQYIQNLNFLRTYFDAGFPAIDPKELEALKRVFQDKASVYLRELLDAPEFTSDVVYKAIADRLVAFDLYNDNLGETDRVSVYRDETTMKFLQKSVDPAVGLPQERLDGTVQPGGKMVLDKREYEILFVDGDKVTAICEEVTREFSLNIVERLHQQGQLKLLTNPLSTHGRPVDASKLGSYSPVELDAALERSRWLEQAALDPDSVPRSPRTLRRYEEARRLAGDSALEQNLALIPKHSLKGNRRRKIPAEILVLATKAIREHFNTPKSISQSNAYLIFSGECATAGLRPCSFRTFSKEIRDLASTRKRSGKRMAYQEGQFINYLKISEEVHGVRPFQMVHIDHTELQILLCLPNSKESLGRAWLTLAVDAESRAVVGFYLTFDPPSYWACMMVMRDIVRRHGRLPEMLVLDNGKLRLANLVAGLLMSDLANSVDSPECGLPEFLKGVVQTHHEGCAIRLAGLLGVTKGTLSGWMSGAHRPEFARILQLAELHGCSLEDVLCGRFDQTKATSTSDKGLSRNSSRRNRGEINWKEVVGQLHEVLAASQPTPLAEVASKVGVSADTLRSREPRLCQAISNRWLAWRKAFNHQRNLAYAEQVQMEAMRVANQGVRPNWQRLLEGGFPRIPIWRWRTFVQGICDEVWEQIA